MSIAQPLAVRELAAADLPAYKALRDEMLARHDTAFNQAALRLYGQAGFMRYGTHPRALRAGRYLDKDLLVLQLR